MPAGMPMSRNPSPVRSMPPRCLSSIPTPPVRSQVPVSSCRASAPCRFAARAAWASATPDEDRVVRADKKGRIIQVSPVAPPKNFNAGSIFQRTSSLLRPSMDSGLKMAFAKPEIKGKEIQIAAAFHIARRQEARSRRAGHACRPGQQRPCRRAGDRLCAGDARLRPGLALRGPAAGRKAEQWPLHSADGQGRPFLDPEPAAGERLLQAGAGMPCQRHLFRGARRNPCAARPPSPRSS